MGHLNHDNILDIASMPWACYRRCMANIQVKNIPEKLHNRLRRYAREQQCTLGEIVLEAIEREVARREWHKRFSGRPSTQLRSSAAELLEEERRQRDSDLS
ncbi:MAG TPA: toxin-antitoxin system HicB family antitoxin [Candidatus Binatia bacterium]